MEGAYAPSSQFSEIATPNQIKDPRRKRMGYSTDQLRTVLIR